MSTPSSAESSTVRDGFRPGGRSNRGAPVEKPKDAKSTLPRLAAYFAPDRKYVLLLAFAVVLAVSANVIAPSLLSRAIDNLVGGSFDATPRILAWMLLAYLVNGGATLLQGYYSSRLTQRVIYRLRSELFGKVISLPIPYLDSHSHGDMMSRMTNDAENVSSVISSSLTSLFSGVLTLIGTSFMMLRYSVPLTLMTASMVVLSVTLTNVISKAMRKYYLLRQGLLGRLNGIVEEKVSACKTVTAYNLQDEAVEEFTAASDEFTHTSIIGDIISNCMGPMMNMINNLSFVIVAAFGAWFVLQGRISVGVISDRRCRSRAYLQHHGYTERG